MKNLPNILSGVRILLGLCLMYIEPLSIVYIGTLIGASVTDFFDGIVARKFNAQSEFGAKLDAIADHLLVLFVVISIAPVVSLNSVSMGLVAGIFIFKAVIIAYTLRKYKQTVFSHSYGHKLGATLCFTCPIPMLLFDPNIVAALIATFMILVMFEELVIAIKSSKPNPNFKGFIFEKLDKGSV